MKLLRRQFLKLAGAVASAPLLPRPASALDYPARPVRIAEETEKWAKVVHAAGIKAE